MSQPEEMLELYQFEGCPYCSKVREKLSELQLDWVSRAVNPHGERERVKNISGQTGVPVLADPNTGEVMPESDDIVEYLEEHYG